MTQKKAVSYVKPYTYVKRPKNGSTKLVTVKGTMRKNKIYK